MFNLAKVAQFRPIWSPWIDELPLSDCIHETAIWLFLHL